LSDKEYGFNNASGEDKDFFDDELELELKNPSNNEAAVKIFVREEVVSDILSYSKTDTSRELGGVLLGRYEEENGKYRVVIEETIIAQHTEAGLSQVTFTHETWGYIHHVMDNKYPNLKMVGWFHTHPGFGIFMSEDDYFIHNNFFSKPWSVAYVVDPVKKQDGFFGWSNGNIVRIPDRHINDVLKKAEPEKQSAYISRENKTVAIKASIWQRVFSKLYIFILVFILGLSLMANFYLVDSNDLNVFMGTNDAKDIIEEPSSNSLTNSEIAAIVDNKDLKEQIKEQNEEIEELTTMIEKQEEEIKELKMNNADSGDSSPENGEVSETVSESNEESGTDNASNAESNHN